MDHGYALAPQDQAPAGEEPSPPAPQPESPPEGRFQFSLAELLLLVSAVGMILGLLRGFPRPWAAFLAGVGTLLSLAVLSVLKPDRAIVHLGWWAMLLVYLLTCIAAVLGDH